MAESKTQALMDAALAAIPETGEIVYADLVQNLKTAGNGDAIPLIVELKRRKLVAAKLEFVEGEGVRHTYSRVSGGGE